MQISTGLVGRKSPPLDVTLSARQCMNFAAGVGDSNPHYFADDAPGGIIAPPMLAVALTWKLSRPGDAQWLYHGLPKEVLSRQVHYSESIEWRRMMRPDEVLRITGEVAAVLPHRSGTHLVVAYTARDTQGEIVFIERSGGLLRGVTCSDEGGGDLGYVPPDSDANAEGEILWEQRLQVDPLAAHVYDGCADIHFPIHTSPVFAQSVGLPGIIYQGTATLTLALREIVNREFGGDIRMLRGLQCKFTGMIPLDSSIRVVAFRKEIDEVCGETNMHFGVYNQEAKLALRAGLARFI